jgi:hypothetical protein
VVEFYVVRRARTGITVLLALTISMMSLAVTTALSGTRNVALAAPITLTFEPVVNQRVGLGALASRTQCGPLTKQGVGPFTMSGTDARSGAPYSYTTNGSYTNAQQLREADETSTTISYTSATNQSILSRTGILELSSSGTISFNNSCSFGGSNVGVYGSAFGPQVWTQAFQATAGQALSFDWAAQGGGDDYEVYAFLVGVANSSDYGSEATTSVLAYGRGRSASWTTSTGLIPSSGWYRFRFVNGSYDASGGYVLGAKMYIDPRVLVGEANNVSFGSLSDRVTSSVDQAFSISATTTSNGVVSFTSTTTGRCTVGASSLSGGVSSATVTILRSQTGLCTISADSASTGEFATAATVTRSFTILAAPTAPTNSGGTSVSGTAAVGQTLTAIDGSWADGGRPISATTYQWQSCVATSCSYSAVAGANDSTFLLGSSDVGKRLRVIVTKTNEIGSTSATSSETVAVAKGNQAPLIVSATEATFGQPLTLHTSGGSGSGVVTFTKVSGTCGLSGDVLTPGDAESACVVSASKAGDAAFNPVTSANTTITVVRAAQAPVVVTSTEGTFGVDLTLTSSGGTGQGITTWSVVSGACSVAGALLTPTAAGSSCVVRATKAADTNYLAQSSVNTTVNFARASQLSPVVVTPMTLTYGDSSTLLATGGSGTGALSFSKVSGPCEVSGSSVLPADTGVCVVTATRLGDSNYLEATSVGQSLAITTRPLSFSVTASNKPFDNSRLASILVSNLVGVVNGDDVSVNGSRIDARFADVEVGQNKVVELTLQSGLLQGNDASKYRYVVPTNPRADIVRASQVSLSFMNAASKTVGTPLELDPRGGSGTGGTTYSVSPGDCSISANQLTATKGGITCVVTATKAGDGRYTSVSASQTVIVNKIVQQLRFQNSAPVSPLVGTTYTATVVSDAFLAATLAVANASSIVCSLNADVITFLSPGSCLISASQSGTDSYAAAAISQSITVVAAPPPPAPQLPATTTPLANVQNNVVGTPATTIPPPPTTTTTVPPNQGDPSQPMTDSSGVLPSLELGTTTVMVRGQLVQAEVTVTPDVVVVRLPNEVSAEFGISDDKGLSLSVDSDGSLRVLQSHQLRVYVTGLIPGTTYTAYLFSTPVEIGRGIANAEGIVDEMFPVPKEIKPGSHTLQVNGVGPNAEVVSISMGIAVMEKHSNTRLVGGLISLSVLLAMFIPLSFRRRFLVRG